MRFSLIIPVYNAEKTLSRCLDSILSQDFDDYEVLCIDDGSKDSSLKILEAYARRDSRIRIICQPNSGPAAARNRGLDNAQGEWILFVDADDYLMANNVLGSLQNIISNQPNCELVYFAGEVDSQDGKYHDSLAYHVYDAGYQCMEDNCNLSKYIVFGALYVQCYNRSIIESHHMRFDADIVYGEDRLFVCSYFLMAGATVVIPDVLYSYVVTSNSLMQDAERLNRQADDNMKVACRLDERLQKSGLNLQKLKKYIHNLYIYSAAKSNGSKNIDWHFLFRNASTYKLFVKDILLLFGTNLYK